MATSTAYDPYTGEAIKTTDPMTRVTKREYDDAGRTAAVIENYVDHGSSSSSSSSPSSGGDTCPNLDENRTTRFTYNPDGNQITITAVNPAPGGTGDQVTTYLYGTTPNDSALSSNLLLRAIQYPTDTVERRVEMKYNRAGQVVERKDQADTIHAYDYDVLGRQTEDRIIALGDNVDETILRIATEYEIRGMVKSITSYESATIDPCDCEAGIVNQALFDYNDFGQLITDQQSHDGPVNISTSPKVQYTYAPGSDNSNQIRPTSLIYPDGRVIDYDYGDAGEMNDKLNRIAAIMDDATALAAYKYLGMSSVVEVDYTQPQVKLDLWGGTPGIYTGLDRFGRVVNHPWINYDTDEDIARIQHGYDRNSNRLWRQNDVARALSKKFDQQYIYDGLNRLVDAKTGLLDGSHAILPGSDTAFQQKWSLDYVGNWSCFKQDDDGSDTFGLEQTRTANPVNEITNIAATTGPTWTTPQYDPAGNTTSFPKPAAPTESFTAIYDAWNRMTRVIDNETDDIVQENVYDGRNFRVIKKTYDAGILDKTRHIYYTSSWRAIEDRLGTDPDSADPAQQYAWGIRYIDDLVLRDRDTSEPPDGVLNERLYAIQDPNWNVTTIIDNAGDVQERYEYEAYGTPVFLNNSWTYTPATAFQWNILYAGYRREATSGLYGVRHRSLHSTLGQWMQRDPLGYNDGISTYQYALSAPLSHFDPHGLEVFEIPDTEEGTILKGTITITVSPSRLCSCIADEHQRGPVVIRPGITITISAVGLSIQDYADRGVAVIDGTEAKFVKKRIDRKLAIVATHHIERPPCPRGVQQGTHMVGLVYNARKGQKTFTDDGKETLTTGVIQLYQVRWTYYCIDTGTDCIEAIPFTATVVNTRPGKDQIIDDVTEGNLPLPK